MQLLGIDPDLKDSTNKFANDSPISVSVSYKSFGWRLSMLLSIFLCFKISRCLITSVFENFTISNFPQPLGLT